ncbi:hypothetical protein CEUSTIGMA_g6369.t1 [Chlamydomonas eustigma]|uniref:Rit1 N-terminal domain-containing protein n=1 Tax=Chlamydomonas eustigma TaxID=1157962 RepID=A0A250X840_9CHLO|nr:hypothetical protein CEUSTIGMA_g6369.t1 [Chlamydomonas eustigma]|eukprot:GAX78930.1 hypothetical protein CEUSTIGMA_g6369.t1 [Chlamydomonas eustigma]
MVKTRCLDGGAAGESIQYGNPDILSVNRVSRLLKIEQNSLFNCLNSIVHDAEFVDEVKNLYPSLPLLANLRCGLWYVRPDHQNQDNNRLGSKLKAPESSGEIHHQGGNVLWDTSCTRQDRTCSMPETTPSSTDPSTGASENAHKTCYFKSTDGHYGNWSFSTTRLNWHVAMTAAYQGGALIVDATRKGKTFSDAFSKTIPIWAAVVNRAVACVKNSNMKQFQAIEGGLSNAYDDIIMSSWDCSLHLPLCVSGTEAAQIEERIDGWVEDLFQTVVDVTSLVQVLRKPLRPLWISQSSLIWINQVAQPEDLSFTPLILVSASQPLPYERKRSPLCSISSHLTMNHESVMAPKSLPSQSSSGCHNYHNTASRNTASRSKFLSSVHHQHNNNEGLSVTHEFTIRGPVAANSNHSPVLMNGIEDHASELSLARSREMRTMMTPACCDDANEGNPVSQDCYLGSSMYSEDRRRAEQRDDAPGSATVQRDDYDPGFARVRRAQQDCDIISTADRQASNMVHTEVQKENDCLDADIVSASDEVPEAQTWSYVYVPGAGDDEESWAAGLTPTLFWENQMELLSAGPMSASAYFSEPSRSMSGVTHTAGALMNAKTGVSNPLSGIRIGNVPPAAHHQDGLPLIQAVQTDAHHLKPAGCSTEGASSNLLSKVALLNPSPQQGLGYQGATACIFFLGYERPGIALGSFTSGGPALSQAWQHVGAVLNIGTAEHHHTSFLATCPSNQGVEHVSTSTQMPSAATQQDTNRPSTSPSAEQDTNRPTSSAQQDTNRPSSSSAQHDTNRPTSSAQFSAQHSQWSHESSPEHVSVIHETHHTVFQVNPNNDESTVDAAASLSTVPRLQQCSVPGAHRPTCQQSHPLDPTPYLNSSNLSLDIQDPSLFSSNSEGSCCYNPSLNPTLLELALNGVHHGMEGPPGASMSAFPVEIGNKCQQRHQEAFHVTATTSFAEDVDDPAVWEDAEISLKGLMSISSLFIREEQLDHNFDRQLHNNHLHLTQEDTTSGRSEKLIFSTQTSSLLISASCGSPVEEPGCPPRLDPHHTTQSGLLVPTDRELSRVMDCSKGGVADVNDPAAYTLSDDGEDFTFCSSPRGLPCYPYISVSLNCTKSELKAMRDRQRDADIARHDKVEASMNRISAQKATEAYRIFRKRGSLNSSDYSVRTGEGVAPSDGGSSQSDGLKGVRQTTRLDTGGTAAHLPTVDITVTTTRSLDHQSGSCHDLHNARQGNVKGEMRESQISSDNSRRSLMMKQRLLPSYQWLPVESSKANRFAMMRVLGPALEFLSHHMSLGRSVLIVDDLGTDQCVCLAVALLLACYTTQPPQPSRDHEVAAGCRSNIADHLSSNADVEVSSAATTYGNADNVQQIMLLPHYPDEVSSSSSSGLSPNQHSHQSLTSMPQCLEPSLRVDLRPQNHLPQQQQPAVQAAALMSTPTTSGCCSLRFLGPCCFVDGKLILPEGFQKITKLSVRQALAQVSKWYPLARPTRGMLKQVYNFFEAHQQG